MIDDDLLALTAGRDMWSTVATENVPSIKMADGPMGIASGRVDERDISILTPSGIALAATWDPALVGKVGALVGGEAKRQGVDLVLAPNLNLARSPNAGRDFELFGEDPLLAGMLGTAWIGGLQSRNVGAVAKHLVCNDSETGRDRYDAIVDETALREIYLLPFEMAARAGCAGLLAAYNKLNGDYCAQNAHILTQVVRQDWGYTGFTVSDWFGTHAGAASINAGLDLEMPGPPRFMGVKLNVAVQDGSVAAARIAEAADRVATAARTWSGGSAGPEPGNRDTILKEAAAASFTLLRNDGDLLPIVPGSTRRIAVIGPNALAPCFQGGTFAKIALRPDAILPLDALAARYGTETIAFAPGCSPSPRLPGMVVRPARAIGDDDGRGMTVDYFDSHDFSRPPLGSETRNTNSLTWFHGMHDLGTFDRAAGVRAGGWFTPAVDGVHRLHIGGTGSVRLLVDGQALFSAERAIPASDIMGILKTGDSDVVELSLTAGTPVLIEAELRYQPARAHGLWYGVGPPADAEAMLVEAEALARSADVVLMIVGETADAGVESKDRDTTALPDDQRRLVERIVAANPRTIVAVNVGHAFDVGFARDAAGLLAVWYPGEAFGPALAAIFAGDLEPCGRLPVVLAANEADYPTLHAHPDDDSRLAYADGTGVGYRGMIASRTTPAFAFGAGLGYGRFTLLSADATTRPDGEVAIAMCVRNDADRASVAVIQAYREDGALAGFARRAVPAGATATVSLTVPAIALRRWQHGGWQRRRGTVTLGIGTSSLDLPLSITVEIE